MHLHKLFLATAGIAILAVTMDPGMSVAAAPVVQLIPDEPMDSYKPEGWSDEDSYLLAKIAMAEAEGEDTAGKALVMCVVLNLSLIHISSELSHQWSFQPPDEYMCSGSAVRSCGSGQGSDCRLHN